MQLSFKWMGIFALTLSIIASTNINAQNDLAPAFSLKDINTSQAVSLSDYKGKVVYLDFWASWCGPCRKSFPAMEKLYQTHAPKGFQVLTINLDENPTLGLGFLKNFNVSFINLYDDKKTTPVNYKVGTMPSSFLIDRSGMIRHRHQGFKDSDYADLDAAISLLLTETK